MARALVIFSCGRSLEAAHAGGVHGEPARVAQARRAKKRALKEANIAKALEQQAESARKKARKMVSHTVRK